MTYFRGMPVVLAAFVLIGCDLFTADVAEDRTLYPLHNAIEATLTVENGSADHPTDPLDTVTPEDTADPLDGHLPADTHGTETTMPDTDGDEATPPDGHGDPGAATETGTIPTGATAAVAVVAIVDSYFLKQTDAEGEEPDPVELENARRRERVTRQEIQNSLVENKLIDALPRDEANEALAREEILAHNSAELSTALAAEIGDALTAQIIVCALIDEAGKEVNIVAQLTTDGRLIYQDTLSDWQPVMDAISAPAAE